MIALLEGLRYEKIPRAVFLDLLERFCVPVGAGVAFAIHPGPKIGVVRIALVEQPLFLDDFQPIAQDRRILGGVLVIDQMCCFGCH